MIRGLELWVFFREMYVFSRFRLTNYIFISLLKEGDIYLNPSPLKYRPFIQKVADFSIPITQEKLSIFMRSSARFESNIFSFIALIDWIFWLKILFWLLFMLLIIIIVYLLFSPKYKFTPINVIQLFKKTVLKHLIGGKTTSKY